jgi:hypothetical protein
LNAWCSDRERGLGIGETKMNVCFTEKKANVLWDSLKELCMLISRSLERKGFCNRIRGDLSCLWNILMEMDHWTKMKEVEYVWSRVRTSNFAINLQEIFNYTILHFESWWLKDRIKIIGEWLHIFWGLRCEKKKNLLAFKHQRPTCNLFFIIQWSWIWFVEVFQGWYKWFKSKDFGICLVVVLFFFLCGCSCLGDGAKGVEERDKR